MCDASAPTRAGEDRDVSMGLSLRFVQNGDGEFLFRLYASTRQEEISSWNWDAQQQAAFLHLQFKAQSLGYSADYPDAAHSLILQTERP